MKAILEIEMPECCMVCPIMFASIDAKRDSWIGVCSYTKKCILGEGEKNRLRDCPLKPANEHLEDTLLAKDFMEFPAELNKKCTREEFHKMMTSFNSDISVDKVKFLDYKDE